MKFHEGFVSEQRLNFQQKNERGEVLSIDSRNFDTPYMESTEEYTPPDESVTHQEVPSKSILPTALFLLK